MVGLSDKPLPLQVAGRPGLSATARVCRPTEGGTELLRAARKREKGAGPNPFSRLTGICCRERVSARRRRREEGRGFPWRGEERFDSYCSLQQRVSWGALAEGSGRQLGERESLLFGGGIWDTRAPQCHRRIR